jgi:hypothetical protein
MKASEKLQETYEYAVEESINNVVNLVDSLSVVSRINPSLFGKECEAFLDEMVKLQEVLVEESLDNNKIRAIKLVNKK